MKYISLQSVQRKTVYELSFTIELKSVRNFELLELKSVILELRSARNFKFLFPMQKFSYMLSVIKWVVCLVKGSFEIPSRYKWIESIYLNFLAIVLSFISFYKPNYFSRIYIILFISTVNFLKSFKLFYKFCIKLLLYVVYVCI